MCDSEMCIRDRYKAAGRIWGVIDKENIKKIKFPRVPKEIVDGFKALEDDLTGTVSDILDALGYNKVIPGSYLKPIEPGHMIVGTAVTLRSIPIEKTTTQGLIDHDFIKMASREVNYLAEPGDVLVGDAGGMTDMSSMGAVSYTHLDVYKRQRSGCGTEYEIVTQLNQGDSVQRVGIGDGWSEVL